MSGARLKAGEFTGLAKDYSQSRPDYAASVARALFGLLARPPSEIDFVDVGAGTGIWTRMAHGFAPRSIAAVEPNDDMRTQGERDSVGLGIRWRAGSAEATGLPEASCDFLTMASSLHWADFDKAIYEFHRVLRPGGRFAALWNPRLIEISPLLTRIETKLDSLKPGIKRVSSGRSGITATLTERLSASPYFEDVVYLEGRHIVPMSRERYIGAWRSVNDVRVQLGSEKFEAFLAFIETETKDLPVIEATYLTRAWSVRRRD